jgi:hypothetical protein
MGILPLDQPDGEHGQIEDPVMICPVCEEEFRATGMKWLGAFDVAKLTDEEIHKMAEQIVDTWFPEHSGDRLHGISDDLIDPFGGPDEPDPDLTPPREEGGPGH